jgi:hypothetical protein
MHVPGPRPAAAAPIRLAAESDAAADVMPRGRSHFSDDSNGGSFIRSRQAEEAAARARSLSNENQLSNLRSSPWQDADSDRSGSAALAGPRRPSAAPLGDGGSGGIRVVQQVPASSAPEPLAVFEKPLLSALSGEDVGGIPAAEVSCSAHTLLPPPPPQPTHSIIAIVTNLRRIRLTPTWRALVTTSAWAGLRASTGRAFQRIRWTVLSNAAHESRPSK